MKKILAILLILCCSLPAIAKKRQNEEIITPMTQLEKRQFQTRTYSAQDNVIAMKAILNVLQDEGYIVYNVNSLLGYIYGIKDFDLSDPNIDISKEFSMTKSRLNYNGVKVATLEASVNITQYGDKSRIRVNFKRKLLNQYGNAQMIDDVSDVEFYNDFYTKVDTAINLQKEIAQKINKPTPPAVRQNQKKNSNTLKNKKPVIAPEPENAEEGKNEENINNNEKINTETNAAEKAENVNGETEEKDSIIAPETTEIKEEKTDTEKKANKKEKKQEEQIPPENNINNKNNTENAAPVNQNEETQDIKELIKQAKKEAKQAEKEAKQAAKEARKAEKESIKEAKKQAKETKE